MDKETIRILLIEDNPPDARLVLEMCKEPVNRDFKITHVLNLQEAFSGLGKGEFDAIIVDLGLPDSHGLDTLEIILTQAMNVPVIVLTGNDDEDMGIKAIKKHATDYLVKGRIDASLLNRSIRYSIERKKIEAELLKSREDLKKSHDGLEKQVWDRTRELVGAQIEIERAKHLSGIGILAATIAHELRNPLAAINMAAANIKRKAQNPALDKHLANIEKKVFESDQIINNLLFYSRIKPPHHEKIDINQVINECAQSLQPQFKDKKKISVTEVLDPTHGIFIEADPVQIKEVLYNILNNAGDSLPDSGGKVEIFTEDKGDIIAVYVNDNGSGIDKEHLSHIFDPFFTTKSKGTGLGLAVCQQIVNLHGGTLTIKSEPGMGTKASISLPKSKC